MMAILFIRALLMICRETTATSLSCESKGVSW